jgi:hypothetical protein
MAKYTNPAGGLYSAHPGLVDIGLTRRRWHTVYLGGSLAGIHVYTSVPLPVANLGRRSQTPGLAISPADDGKYFVSTGIGWVLLKVDDPPPDPQGQPAYSALRVENGAWTPGVVPDDRKLPAAWPEDGWLTVVAGEWDSHVHNYSVLPDIADGEHGKVLGVIESEWRKVAADNFYLPWEYAISPDVPHAVTVAGDRWLKRPLARANAVSPGLVPGLLPGPVPAIPGDPRLSLAGDGRWASISGDDYGKWRPGDVRPAGARTAAGWLALDGTGLGRVRPPGLSADVAFHHGAKYHELYILLHPVPDDWSAGVPITLENRPGYEMLALRRQDHAVYFSVFAGPVEGGPYLLQLADSPDFARVLFESDSFLEPGRWSELEGVAICNLAGLTRETYYRLAEEAEPAAAPGAGFFFTRYRGSDGRWVHGRAWATEDNVFRLDTAVNAGVMTAGSLARSSPCRLNLPVINGRPAHYPHTTARPGLYGLEMDSDTSARNEARHQYTEMADDFLAAWGVVPTPEQLKDPFRQHVYAEVDTWLYGGGDLTLPALAAPRPELRTLMDQLGALDGYARLEAPGHVLVKLPYGAGRHNWWGGCLGEDGNVYFIPHFAESVLVISPKFGFAPAERLNTLGKFTAKHGKWSGGVTAPDGRIFCLPYNHDRFLVIDSKNGTAQRTGLGLSALELAGSVWAGGCLHPDGTIRAFPLYGRGELVIYPAENRAVIYNLGLLMATIYDPDGNAPPKYMNDWYYRHEGGGNGAYTIRGFATAKYDFTGKGAFLRYGPYTDERPADYGGRIALDDIPLPWAGDTPSRGASMFGGACLTLGGQLMAAPCGVTLPARTARRRNGLYRATDYADYPADIELLGWDLAHHAWNAKECFGNDTAVNLSANSRAVDHDMFDRSAGGGPADYMDATGSGPDTGIPESEHTHPVDVKSRVKYLGGVLGPDGNNYFVPCGGGRPDVLVVPPARTAQSSYPSSSFRVPDLRYATCRGAILGPDGCVYSAAADGTAFFALSPRTRQVRTVELNHPRLGPDKTAWLGAVVGPDGWIYFVPHDSECLLVVDPRARPGPWRGELNHYLNKF